MGKKSLEKTEAKISKKALSFLNKLSKEKLSTVEVSLIVNSVHFLFLQNTKKIHGVEAAISEFEAFQKSIAVALFGMPKEALEEVEEEIKKARESEEDTDLPPDVTIN